MHQDYVLRMIQQMGLFVTHLLKKRREGDDEGALIEIQEAYGRMTGLHASLVYGLSEDDVVNMLTVQGAVHPERLVALGVLLREEGDIYSSRGDVEDALPRMQKALRLFLEAWDRSDALRYETIPGLDATISWMDGYPVTSETRRLLMQYLEEKGRFDEAENYVLDWAEGGTEDALTYASDFYQRLLGLSDAELIVGGLTRDEVQSALDDLK
jgi:tetratricopeptide (TPR) repeat protein